MVNRLKLTGLETVNDLLNYLPFRHDDYSLITPINKLRIGNEFSVKAAIQSINTQRTSRKRLVIVKAQLVDETGHISAIWFGQAFLLRTLTIGSQWIFHGKVEFDRAGGKVLVSPSYDTQAGILPVYHESQGLTVKWLRRIVKPLLHATNKITDYLPSEIIKKNKLIQLPLALSEIHFPSSNEKLNQAKERLGFDELFLISLRLLNLKREILTNTAPFIAQNTVLIQKFINSLPYKLTGGQKRAIDEILSDIAIPRPMNRLLEGEVGSGKTVVAAAAALATAKSGFQTAWLAPTEILANQHYSNVSKLLKPFHISISLMTKTTKLGTKADIIIGTHALLQKDITFENLGLVIVDEQHRFGVKQRSKLKGANKNIPHFLSMTATPIPRTLALTLYGDLDLSIIDELPPGRPKIITRVVDQENRKKAYQFIRDQVKAGRQVFVITPLIEQKTSQDSINNPQKTLFEEIERRSAVVEFEKLRRHIFPDLSLGLLHGRLSGKEKESVMANFKDKKIDIIVSTAVVEVGIDIPNATVMMIEDADRFGLAQLHQFRGRVGRGKHQSYCLLFSSVVGAMARLKTMEQFDNGFKLAEVDLKMRGPGELVGNKQSGMPDLKMATLLDIVLITKARKAAQEIIDKGITRFPTIFDRLNEFERINHLE